MSTFTHNGSLVCHVPESWIMLNIRQLYLQVRPIVPSDVTTFPLVSQPNVIGAFGITRNRFYEKSLGTLRYFLPPKAHEFPLDVKLGIEDAIRKPDTKCFECLDHILNFIFDNQEKLVTADVNGKTRVNADVICSRPVLEKLLATPYEENKDWRLHVSQFNKTIYMCDHVTTQEEFKSRRYAAEQEKLEASRNYKLQQYCMSEKPNEKLFKSGPVDECPELNCVYEFVMEGFKLMYNAEMNGAIASETQPNSIDPTKLKFVQLKTRPMQMNRQQWSAYKRTELIRWWCQCYLVGILNIQVGFYDINGLVQKIEEVNVYKLRKESEDEWAASACLNFLIRFLNCIKRVMMNVDNPSTVYEFHYEARTGNITYVAFEGRSEYTFIPDWYRDILLK